MIATSVVFDIGPRLASLIFGFLLLGYGWLIVLWIVGTMRRKND